MTATWRPVVRRPNRDVIPWGELGGPYPSEESLRVNLPLPIRQRLLAVVCRPNPVFLNMLTPDEQITFDAATSAMKPIYSRTGVEVYVSGMGYTNDEYFDHYHLTVAGGAAYGHGGRSVHTQ